MKLIAAVDRNWGIGYQGKLLVSIPRDLKNFAERTTGQIVIAGRKTLETFPGGQPLLNRTNLILTKKKALQIKNTRIANSVEQVLELVKEYPEREVFVVGGQSVYEQLLPFCTEAYITWIDHEYMADAYIRNLDVDKEWTLAKESEEQTYFDLEYSFRLYVRNCT